MARSRPARPAARPAAPARPPTQQQPTRPATTYTAPTQQRAGAAPPPPAAGAASQGPGLFGQMASTAAGVAVGSSIGHAIGGMFSGGSSAPAEPTAAAPSEQAQNSQWGNNCAGATQNFTKCMDENGGNMQICNWYLEQLKACQAAASQY
ncbi:hypothetical protein RB594_005045 [Gaeumannomyces avenae]